MFNTVQSKTLMSITLEIPCEDSDFLSLQNITWPSADENTMNQVEFETTN